jgi:hypothetical protein
VSTLFASQVGVRHVVPGASRLQAPAPLHPPVHASNLQVPVGSAPPDGTGLQVPIEPSRAQDWHVPEQAVAQHRPCAQNPDWQSSATLHREATGRLPHEPLSQRFPLTHWVSEAQKVAQRLPLQPRKGAHERGCGSWHEPLLQTAAATSLLAEASQEPDRQGVPLAYRSQPRRPSHRPLVPQVPGPWSTQIRAGSVTPMAARGSGRPAATATHVPRAFG